MDSLAAHPASPTQPLTSIERESSDFSHLSTVALLEALITHAVTVGASDIHLDPGRMSLGIRMRKDGMLYDIPPLPTSSQGELIARLKILASLRTDEHHAAQDGRFRFVAALGEGVDVRVSIAPTYYGENAVLRLLTTRGTPDTLQSLGFSDTHATTITDTLTRPHGLILVTGPTGSGKSTTLYTLIKMLRKESVSILTIEDPIEYSLDGVNQIPVHAQTGLTFERGLRSILRQDPDIIMVGEIRDRETAQLAVNAALTGHLVLSTLHTTDAPTALPRLLDLGVEPYLIASTLRMVIGQRLVRTICRSCKAEKPSTSREQAYLPIPTERLCYGKGCESCAQSGYVGRVGIYEVLELSSSLRDAIMNRSHVDEFQQHACDSGMLPMESHGLQHVQSGVTTLEEVIRVRTI